MRRGLGRYDAGGTPPDASGLGGRGAGLSRFVVPTEQGPAAVELVRPDGGARALVVLGHGAGGGIRAPDLSALASILPGAGFPVALVEQPYRVAGRRSPPPQRHLDLAWLTVVAQLVGQPGLAGRPLVVGGRSSGARVACRTAAASGAAAVVALAFPLRPPGRSQTRLGELLAVPVPTLVVQGAGTSSAADPTSRSHCRQVRNWSRWPAPTTRSAAGGPKGGQRRSASRRWATP